MKYSTFLILLLLSANLFAQQKPKTVLSTTQTRVLYYGIDNPIEVMVEGSPLKKFSVKVDSGTIKKIDQYHYEITPIKVGLRIVTVTDSKGVKLLEEVMIVKAYPPPIFQVGGRVEGTFSIPQLKAQGGISMFRDCFFNLYAPKSTVIGYTAKIFRNSDLIVQLEIKGNQFSKELRQAFNDLKVDDKVVFENIIYECLPCVSKEKYDSPLVFMIE
jgi:hypothetical protein